MKFLSKHFTLFSVILVLLVAFSVRFVAATVIPPGLYIDEVSIGNNAYAILTQGVDEHNVSYPLWFKAFGEYKMPVMIYLVSGAMIIVGKTEIAIRLPSILAGTMSVLLLYVVLSELCNKAKEKYLTFLPILSAALLAITPWHIHFSRGGFEATVALCLFLGSVYTFLRYREHKKFYLIGISLLLLALSAYTYNTYRIISSATFFFYLVSLKNSKGVTIKMLGSYVVLFIVMLLPLLVFSFSPEGSERFRQTASYATYIKKPLMDQVLLIPIDFINNYLRYFSFEFLFAIGDQNGRHQVPGMGLFYRWEFLFFVIGGLGFFKRKKDMLFYLTFFLLLLAPIPAALTIPSPHSLRSLIMVIPLTIIVAQGMLISFQVIRSRKLAVVLGVMLMGIIVVEGIYYHHLYTEHYTKVNILDWGAGYKETIKKAATYTEYERVVFDRNLGDIEPFIKFYGSSLSYEIIGTDWKKPASLTDKKVLLVRPDYKERDVSKRIGVVRIPNANQDIFSEFYPL